jgi:hypothetical protein
VFYRFAISVLILLLPFSAIAQAPATGTLQGHLKIVSLETVQLADGSVPTVTPETYREYPLVVLSSDSKKEIATVTANSEGNFHTTLLPGSYILDIQNRARRHVRAKPVPFTVIAKQTVQVNMEMDTGVR